MCGIKLKYNRLYSAVININSYPKRARELASLQLMAEISSLLSYKAEMRMHYGVHENDSPLLFIPADLCKCIIVLLAHIWYTFCKSSIL